MTTSRLSFPSIPKAPCQPGTQEPLKEHNAWQLWNSVSGFVYLTVCQLTHSKPLHLPSSCTHTTGLTTVSQLADTQQQGQEATSDLAPKVLTNQVKESNRLVWDTVLLMTTTISFHLYWDKHMLSRDGHFGSHLGALGPKRAGRSQQPRKWDDQKRASEGQSSNEAWL